MQAQLCVTIDALCVESCLVIGVCVQGLDLPYHTNAVQHLAKHHCR
jgi:hypothetical protein